METRKNGKFYLVLVPHRDTRVLLKKYSDSLLKAGLKDIYLFPLAAPMAELEMPLNKDELKLVAKSLRLAAGKNKIFIEEMAFTELTESKGMMFFGPRLGIEIPNDFFNNIKKILSPINPSVIGMYMKPKKLQSGGSNPVQENFSVQLSFRAAAVANMIWKPIRKNEETYYKWKIGKLYWLPKWTGNL